MNLRNLFRISAALSLIFGLVWLLAPGAMPAAAGQALDPYGAYFLQQLGAFNIAFAILFFLVSGMASTPARQAVATSMIVLQGLSLIVSLLAVLGGVVPAAGGWFSVAYNLVFGLAFAYFRFIRPETNMSPELQS